MERASGLTRARLLLADDHTLVLEGIRRLLEPYFELVAIARDGRAVVKAVEEKRPDIVLLDITMPGLNGIDAARQIKRICPAAKLIFLTMHADREYVSEAFRAGASGYLLKWSAEEELTTAIQTVLEGRTYVTPMLPQGILDILPKRAGGKAGKPTTLTARQQEVLQLVAEGRAAKEIAGILHLSVKTVEFHKYQMMKKLGLHTAVELAKYAVQKQLLGTAAAPQPETRYQEISPAKNQKSS